MVWDGSTGIWATWHGTHRAEGAWTIFIVPGLKTRASGQIGAGPKVLVVMVWLAAPIDGYGKGVGRLRGLLHIIFGEALGRAPIECKQAPENKGLRPQQGKVGHKACDMECGIHALGVEGRAVGCSRQHQKQSRRPIKPSIQHIQFWREGSSRGGAHEIGFRENFNGYI